MEIQIKELGECKRELSITIDNVQVMQEYNKVLSNFKKYISLDGFRKGKAPNSIIEKKYGDAIKEEFEKEHLDKFYSETLKEKEITPVANGKLEKCEWDKKSPMKLVFTYDVEPAFENFKYENIEVAFSSREITKEDIQNGLLEVQKKHSTLQESEEKAEENDQISVKMKFISENNKNKDASFDRVVVVGDEFYGKKFNEDILSCKKGDVIFTELEFLAGEDKKVKKVELTVNNVKKVVLPELNDEFAKSVEFDTLDLLKKSIENKISKEIQLENNKAKKIALLESLYKENEFEIPMSLAEYYAYQMAEKYYKMYNIEIEKLYPMYINLAKEKVKEYFLMNKLEKEINLAVPKDEDIEKYINIKSMEMQIFPEEFKAKYNDYLETDDFKEEIKNFMLIETLAEKVKFVPKKENEKKD